jgi:hypothetical protein
MGLMDLPRFQRWVIFREPFLASDHKILRLCDLCKELGFDSSGAHTVSEGWFGKLRPTLVWCLLCPLASMVPVLWR